MTGSIAPKSRQKVLILGSGAGAISAAFALSETEERREAFEVTVATQGWRIGGKGASGRRRSEHQRIEEHGLHIFLGFYRSIFAGLKQAYEALDGAQDGVFPSIEAAFRPEHQVTLWIDPGKQSGGEWHHYTLTAPEWPGKPWEPAESADEALRRAPRRLAEMMMNHAEPALVGSLGQSPHEGRLTGRLTKLRAALPSDGATQAKSLGLGEEIGHLFSELRSGAEGILGDLRTAAHLLYDLLEIGTAVIAGYLEDILPYGWDNFDRINDQDFRKWLRSHGASERASWSEGVRVIYDLGFAYKDGRTAKENTSMAAGAALKLVLRMVAGYAYAPLWRMNAGMGDTVFTPLYKVIERRGGCFEFFRRVADVHADPDTGLIETVTLIVQAELSGDSYDPFVHVHKLDCWPSEPDWRQLVDGERLSREGVNFEDPWCHEEFDRVTLHRGTDFDHVVLGIPPAAAQYLTQSFGEVSDDWTRMLDKVGGASVATHSVQLWFDRTTEDMGWDGDLPVSGAYMPPLNTWADMSDLIQQEMWGGGTVAKSCQYLVGVVELPLGTPPPTTSSPNFQEQQNAVFKQESNTWLDAAAFRLWPDSAQPGDFDAAQVVGDYDHVNISPSELYVQTPPGAVIDRLPPGWDGIANLWLAGDWTTSSINGGSAEAAYESGQAATEALIQAAGLTS